MLYGRLKRVGPAEFRVDDNQTDGPVDHDGKGDQEHGACDEACVLQSVGLADDASATARVSLLLPFQTVRLISHDAVCHIHE